MGTLVAVSRGRVALIATALVIVIGTAAAFVAVRMAGSDDDPGASDSPTTSMPTVRPTWDGPKPRADFRLATYNLLGASHTRPSGKAPDLPDGEVRLRRSMPWLYQHGVSVVGFQEMQQSQYDTFRALAGDRWGSYSDQEDTENAIAWRTKDWRLVSARTVPVPYFVNERPMPLVVLENKRTGQRFAMLNVHNPANTREFGDREERRFAALRKEIRLLRHLDERGIALVFTGDLNDREQAFCDLTAGGLMHSASGGVAEPCEPPQPPQIDWIFGNDPVRFDDYVVDERPRATGMSDHPMVLAQVRLLDRP